MRPISSTYLKSYLYGPVAILLCIALSFSCTDDSNELKDERSQGSTSSATTFTNLDANYVGEETCATCHEEIVASYQGHGMANSMYPASAANVPDMGSKSVYHEDSDYYYSIENRGGIPHQVEYRLVNGERAHELSYPIEWVVGSGNAAKTYLTSFNDTFYQMPLTWYADGATWNMSPGYEVFNQRFSRRVPDRCIACHNAFPDKRSPKEGQFVAIPEGIGCERCHGPGSEHVDERLANPDLEEGVVDYTIVNPAHLDFDQRMDVCQQCHLNSDVSIVKDGISDFGYRPSRNYTEQLVLFSTKEHSESEVEVISHVERMKKSECFTETQNVTGALECTTCHNPHEGFRDQGPEYFNQTCITCHASDEDQTMPANENHVIEAIATSSNCISCHMPKVNSSDAVHSSFTDHWIRVVSTDKVDQEDVEKLREGIYPYLPSTTQEDKIYEGVAYLINGRRTNSTPLRIQGLEILEEQLRDTTRYEDAYYQGALANQDLKNYSEAAEWFAVAAKINPQSSNALNGLAQAYEGLGRSRSAISKLYIEALRLNPDETNIRTNYARFLEQGNQMSQALQEYLKVTEEAPNIAKGYFNLGTAYLRTGDLEKGKTHLNRCLELDPDFSEALGNLGIIAANENQLDRAEQYFERAIRADPESSVAQGNLGSIRLNQGRYTEAENHLMEATRLDPQNIDALTNLAILFINLGDDNRARTFINRVLQIDPQNARALQVAAAL